MPRVRAPELPLDFVWLNCACPLALKALRGRVVVLDFWTYGCINCLHVLPDLKYLEQKYLDRLTVIGVHSAKFAHEAETESIRQAVLRYGITHPVVVDRDRYLWDQYAVRAWPTLVVIDLEGYVVGSVAGEGHRATLDQQIAQLIQRSPQETVGTIAFSLESLPTTPLAFPGKVLADEKSDRLFIADTGHNRIVIATLQGEAIQTVGTETQFSAPQGLAIDPEHQRLYVADTGNHLLRCVDLQTTEVTTIAGTGKQSRNRQSLSGVAIDTALNSPWDLALSQNHLFIAMAGSHQIWQLEVNAGTLKTYAGIGAEAGLDGEATAAAFAQPSGLATDGQELFVADSESSSVRGVGLGAAPQVRTICGSGDLFDFGDRDGVGEAVRLQHCLGVAFAAGFLWIADTYNHKIKRVNPATGECRTIAGTGQSGLRDGLATIAQFAEPSGLSATRSHLYIADTNNHAIRRLDLTTLKVTTLELPNLCAPKVCLPASSATIDLRR